MEFISRDGEVKRVASTSGHVFLIGKEPVMLPSHIEVEAYASGCIPAVAAMPVVEAADLMIKNNIHHLVVTEDGSIKGIISSFDLLKGSVLS